MSEDLRGVGGGGGGRSKGYQGCEGIDNIYQFQISMNCSSGGLADFCT